MLPSREEVRRAATKERRARASGAASDQKKVVTKAAKKKEVVGAGATVAEERRKRHHSPTPAQPSSPSLMRRPRMDSDVDLTADTPPEEPRMDIQLPPPLESETRAEVAPEPAPEPVHEPVSEPAPEVVQVEMVDDVPMAEGATDEPPRAMDEAGTSAPSIPPAPEPAAEDETVLSFKSLLECEGRWTERTMAQVCLLKLQGILQE